MSLAMKSNKYAAAAVLSISSRLIKVMENKVANVLDVSPPTSKTLRDTRTESFG